MKKKALLIVALLAAAFAGVAVADDDNIVIERKINLKIVTDGGEVLDLDNLGDMEPGDVQQLYTDNGTPVTVERTESGFVITVEGEEPIIVDLDHGHGHGVHVHCEGDDCDHDVVIKKIKHGAHGEGAHAMFIGDDGTKMELHGDHHVWVDKDGEGAGTKVVRIGGGAGGNAIQRLLESGVLDDLTPEKRHEILQALAGDDSKVKIKRRHKHDDDE